MPWFRVDDNIHDHPKAVAAGPYAMGVWLLCGTYAAKQLTDGWVPMDVARDKGGRHWRRAVDRLVLVGLWHTETCEPGTNQVRTRETVRAGHDPGFIIHDYLVYNPTRDAVVAVREHEAARKRRSRQAGGQKRPARTSNGVHPGRQTPDQVPRPEVPSLPPSGGDGYASSVIPSRSDDPPKTFISDPNTNAGSWRSPDVEAQMAALRKRLPHGHRRKPPPPVDDTQPGGA